MTEILFALLEAVRELDPALRTAVAGFGIALETSVFIGLIVPGDSIALLAAVGVNGTAEFIWLVVALFIGALAGESIGFALGRWAGPRIRRTRAGQRLGEQNWRVAERYLGRRGGLAVFLSRFLPVLHALVPLCAGMAGMRYRNFLAWTASASLIWSLLVVSVGAGAAAGFEELAATISGAGYLFVAIVVAAVAVLWIAKRWLFRRELRPITENAHPKQDLQGATHRLGE